LASESWKPNVTEAPLRILYVDTGVGLAGGQVSLLEILKHLDRRRFTPIVASPRGSAVGERCRHLGVTWYRLPFASSHVSNAVGCSPWAAVKDALASLRGVVGLAGLVRRHRIDIVHANTFKAALVGGLACIGARRPMVFHDRVHIAHGWVGQVVTLLSTRIIVVSRAVGSKRRGRVAGKTALIYDGIDVRDFEPAAPRASRDTVGFLGRISEEKGLISLVECASAVIERVPGVSFVIGGAPFTRGDAAHLAQVKARLTELRLLDRFRFTGFVKHPRSFFEGIDVLALPSKNEPLGLVVLEALAVGRPVVAFDTGGPAEILTNGRDGILVRPDDLDGFAAALATALSDEATRRILVENGRRTVTSRFSSDVFVRRVEDLYAEIADSGSRGGRGRAAGSQGPRSEQQ
jgi:glycosyltransferase involved in cell wall biosynthesis